MGDTTTMSTHYPVVYKKNTARFTYTQAENSHTSESYDVPLPPSLCHALTSSFTRSLARALASLFFYFSFSTIQIHSSFCGFCGHTSWWLIDDDSKPFKPNIKR